MDFVIRKWVVIGFGCVLVALLAVAVLPQVVARSMIKDRLSKLRLEVSGAETLETSLLSGTFTVGPLRVGADAEPVAETGVVEGRFGLLALMRGRAHMESLSIDGARLAIGRRDDGAVTIAGVALADHDEGTAPDEPGLPLAPGIDSLTATNSLVTFTDVDGGVLQLEVNRLELKDFRGWEEDGAGTLHLEGRINGAPVAYDGTLSLFADDIRAKLKGGVREIDAGSIERLLGPLGLPRAEGKVGYSFRNDILIDRDGSISGRMDGSISVTGLDLLTRMDDRIFGTARLDLGIEHDLHPERPFRFAGDVAVEAGGVGLTSSKGDSIEIGGLNIRRQDAILTEKEGSRSADLSRSVAARFKARAERQVFSLSDALVELVIILAVNGGGKTCHRAAQKSATLGVTGALANVLPI